MSTSALSFYVTGGTLRQDAPSYVERQADKELYEGLLRSDYCYVLHARQMGKSSLMVHTTARLRQQGVAVAAFELTALGQNLSVEQWYDGLLARIGRNLDLEEELEEYWLAHERLAPLQRWLGALAQVVLARCPGRIVIFLDEIDAVRSLPFSTDEFFAAIRECYNRRSQEPEFARLTFCLLGVATPSDLIQDTRTTPFNVGRRIELADFSETEALPLAKGLGRNPKTGQALLEQVLYWTGGHPYLTQRLCQAVAEDPSVIDAAGVDRHCAALFLSASARERDDNLLFVRERLLRSEVDLASLLDLYAQVRSSKRVAADDANPLIDLLRLSGIARLAGGHLRVRNRIYARVFDRAWVTNHMPDAELRRQRAAYQRGMLRAALVAGAFVAVIGTLALSAIRSESRARRSEASVSRLAEEQRGELYAAQMNLAQQAWQVGDIPRTLALLEAQRPGRGGHTGGPPRSGAPGQEDLRGFEWGYLWRLCHQDQSQFTLRGHTGKLFAVAFSPDGKLLATASDDGTIRLWNPATRRPVAILKGQRNRTPSLAFSPDGRTLALGCGDWHQPPRSGAIRLWDVATRRERAAFAQHRGEVLSLAFSPDGHALATADWDGTVRLWDPASGREVGMLSGHAGAVVTLAFAPDGKTLATSGEDQVVKLWDVATRRERPGFPVPGSAVTAVAFSPDGKILATGSWAPAVRLWDVAARREILSLKGHSDRINALAFSPDGKTLMTASGDRTVRLWDAASGREIHTLIGHKGSVNAAAFTPNGETLVTGGDDGIARLWRVTARREPDTLEGHHGQVSSLAFSPDGRTLASGSWDGTVRLWDVARSRQVACLTGATRRISGIAFSPNGKIVAASTGVFFAPKIPGEVRLWEVAGPTGRPRQIAVLRGHRAGVTSLAFSPNGRLLATGSVDRTVRLWGVGSGRPPKILPDHRAGVGFVRFSTDGETLVTGSAPAYWGGSAPSILSRWDVASLRKISSQELPAGLEVATLSPEGNTVAVRTGVPYEIRLWDLASWRERSVLQGFRNLNSGRMALSPDGRTLAASNLDSTVTLWNLALRRAVATLEGHNNLVGVVAFSPDSMTLATGSGDRTVRLWRAAPFAETDALPGAQLPHR